MANPDPADTAPDFPNPQFGDELEAAQANPDLVSFMLTRRSTPAKAMDPDAPGPNPQERDIILRAGARVPDHGKLAPWRFLVFEGDTRAAFGEVLAQSCAATQNDPAPELLEFERNRFLRAPLVVAVISHVRENIKIPAWEQMLSAGAVCQNMLIAAQGLGFASQWLTEWYAYDPQVLKAMGLGPNERVAGFMYFGAAKEIPRERVRPDLNCLTKNWEPPKAKKPAPKVTL